MKNETEEKAEIILQFMRDAFLVDGEVRFATKEEAETLKPLVWIKLNDSKRGTFYIARNK